MSETQRARVNAAKDEIERLRQPYFRAYAQAASHAHYPGVPYRTRQWTEKHLAASEAMVRAALALASAALGRPVFI